MRWERMMGEKDQPFISPKDFNSDCVCSVSTECIDPLCVWWTTSPNHVVEYCQWKHWTEPVGDKLPKNRLAAMLHDSHRASCIFHINPLVEYLSLNEAYIHEDYQQNRTRASGPDDILGDDSSWRYRMIPSLQTIAQDQRLLEDIRSTLEADENDYEAFKGFS
jgi:4-alpha-glucanotransferase